MKLIHIFSIGLIASTIGAPHTHATWRQNFAKSVRQKAAAGTISADTATQVLNAVLPNGDAASQVAAFPRPQPKKPAQAKKAAEPAPRRAPVRAAITDRAAPLWRPLVGRVKAKFAGLARADLEKIAQRVAAHAPTEDRMQIRIEHEAVNYLHAQYREDFKWDGHLDTCLHHLGQGKPFEQAVRDAGVEKVKKRLSTILDGDDRLRDDDADTFAQAYYRTDGVDFSQPSVEKAFKEHLEKQHGIPGADVDQYFTWIKGEYYKRYRKDTPGADIKAWHGAVVEHFAAQARAARNEDAEKARKAAEEARKAAEKRRQAKQKAWDDAPYEARVAFGSYKRGFFCVDFTDRPGKEGQAVANQPDLYWYVHPDRYKGTIPGQIMAGDTLRFSTKPFTQARRIQNIPAEEDQETKYFRFPPHPQRKIIEWVKRYGTNTYETIDAACLRLHRTEASYRRERRGDICVRANLTRGLLHPLALRECYRYTAQLFMGSYHNGFVAIVTQANNAGIDSIADQLRTLKATQRPYYDVFIRECLERGHARARFRPRKGDEEHYGGNNVFRNLNTARELRETVFKQLSSFLVFISPDKYQGDIDQSEMNIGDTVRFNHSGAIRGKVRTPYTDGDFAELRGTDIVRK